MSEPFKITGPGKYRLRCGITVKLAPRASTSVPYPWHGSIEEDEGIRTWCDDGRYTEDGTYPHYDIVELIKLDAPPAPTPPPFKIEAPGEYVTRLGNKAVVEFKSAMHDESVGPWLGYVRTPSCSIRVVWFEDGRSYASRESLHDIVGPWVEPIDVDWTAPPKWAEYVAKDEDGEWRWHAAEPRICGRLWTNSGYPSPGSIPTEYAPKWKGDWRQSLVRRPTAESRTDADGGAE